VNNGGRQRWRCLRATEVAGGPDGAPPLLAGFRGAVAPPAGGGCCPSGGFRPATVSVAGALRPSTWTWPFGRACVAVRRRVRPPAKNDAGPLQSSGLHRNLDRRGWSPPGAARLGARVPRPAARRQTLESRSSCGFPEPLHLPQPPGKTVGQIVTGPAGSASWICPAASRRSGWSVGVLDDVSLGASFPVPVTPISCPGGGTAAGSRLARAPWWW